MTISMKTKKADMYQHIKDLEKQLAEYTKPIKPTTYVNYEKSIKASYANINTADSDRRILEDRSTKHCTDRTSKEITDGVRPADTPEITKVKTPTAAQLKCFISTVTYNNFEQRFDMPKEFTCKSFCKLISTIKKLPHTVRPGKPTKPAGTTSQEELAVYYADAAAFYKRRNDAIIKLIHLYPAHVNYIRTVFARA